MSNSDRFASFTGWELQALAQGVSSLGAGRPEQLAARESLMEELHNEFERREDGGFTDPTSVRPL